MFADTGRVVAATLAVAAAGFIVVFVRFIQVDGYEQGSAMTWVVCALLGGALLVLGARAFGRMRERGLLVGSMLFAFLTVFWLVFFTTMSGPFRAGLGAVLVALTAQALAAWRILDDPRRTVRGGQA
ncbi:hypothetical protein ACIBG8_54490 [Nonomuraea sp. NPDC050556]|uniref:hypothetical protein n=1 Tax=Nonomuraea sp. NPDC050556 TaxID=3364369 RepID=UPI00378764B1